MLMLRGISDAERERGKHPEPGLRRDDLAIVTHPIRFAKWRHDVHKNGPYAPAWAGTHEPRWTPLVMLALAVGSLAGILVILLLA
jgi:hypothetical protein